MFTAQQYRSKALEYETLLETARSPAEVSEYRDLKQSYAALADNLDWLAANGGKTIAAQAIERPRAVIREPHAAGVEQDEILRCLGAAVILNWATIPTKLQRALFDAASDFGAAETAPSKQALARFLRDHRSGVER